MVGFIHRLDQHLACGLRLQMAPAASPASFETAPMTQTPNPQDQPQEDPNPLNPPLKAPTPEGDPQVDPNPQNPPQVDPANPDKPDQR